MLKEQLEKLEKIEKETNGYLGIGVCRDGAYGYPIAVPWENTVSAFNMKIPDVFLTPEDLEDQELMERLGKLHVVGCYVFEPLQDYSFLTRLPELWDIHIQHGEAITDLSFMKELKQWFMFYLEDAVLENLDPLFPEDWRSKGLHSYCLGLGNCRVADISAAERREIYLSELVIIQPEGTHERKRWENIRAGKYSYFEFRHRREN